MPNTVSGIGQPKRAPAARERKNLWYPGTNIFAYFDTRKKISSISLSYLAPFSNLHEYENVVIKHLIINGIHRCSELLSFILFADDTNTFYSHTDVDVDMDVGDSGKVRYPAYL